MHLRKLVIKGFQCFGPEPTTISLSQRTFLLGPNGAGKTAVLHALSRLFGYGPELRKVRASDFHRSTSGTDTALSPSELLIEAHFDYPELEDDEGTYSTVPPYFGHMTLPDPDDVPQLRIRLTAAIDEDEQIDESLVYVTAVDDDGEPAKTSIMNRHDREMIQVHYLPARRDPADHIRYTTTSLFGRLLRSANWSAERVSISELTGQLSNVLGGHVAVAGLGTHLAERWGAMHSGSYFANPTVSFDASDIDALLRHLTIRFEPAPGAVQADFGRLSDGQQSLLYISLVLAVQTIGRRVLAGELTDFDPIKLRPPVFVLLAVEEPENSLSPHHLGRLLSELTTFSERNDAQAVLATHSPALLRRVPPEQVRYLRLDETRCTAVAEITMPDSMDEAAKYVREAVLAYPELYFSRLVVLGEGDSEEVVLPRLFAAHGLLTDHLSVSVVPLGGRHVNHFWRLLHGLGVPHVTLLDLDAGRYQGGWGRLRYALDQYRAFVENSGITDDQLARVPVWDSADRPDHDVTGSKVIQWLEERGVFFSAPLDLDYTMLTAYPDAYGVTASDLHEPDEAAITAVLGKSHGPVGQYDRGEQERFDAYRERFKRGSKPASHLDALAQLADAGLIAGLPGVYQRLVSGIGLRLTSLPE
jgi:putative ATP-dependent endonuclease of OLD family